jgi:hypothetical protein
MCVFLEAEYSNRLEWVELDYAGRACATVACWTLFEASMSESLAAEDSGVDGTVRHLLTVSYTQWNPYLFTA